MPRIVEVTNGPDIHTYDPRMTKKLLEEVKALPEEVESPAQEANSLAAVNTESYGVGYHILVDPKELEMLKKLKRIFTIQGARPQCYIDTPSLYDHNTLHPVHWVPTDRDTYISDWSMALQTAFALIKNGIDANIGLWVFHDPVRDFTFFKLSCMSFLFGGCIVTDPSVSPGGEGIFFTKNPSEVITHYYYRYLRLIGFDTREWNLLRKQDHIANLYLLTLEETTSLLQDVPKIDEFIRRFTEKAKPSPVKVRGDGHLLRLEVLERGVITDGV